MLEYVCMVPVSHYKSVLFSGEGCIGSRVDIVKARGSQCQMTGAVYLASLAGSAVHWHTHAPQQSNVVHMPYCIFFYGFASVNS